MADDETPQPTGRTRQDALLQASDGTKILVSLVNDEKHVLVSGPGDSLLVPVHGLATSIDESGPVAKQVRSDASYQHREQTPPGVSGLKQLAPVVINGVTYQVLHFEPGADDQWRIIVGPVPL